MAGATFQKHYIFSYLKIGALAQPGATVTGEYSCAGDYAVSVGQYLIIN